MNVASLKNIVRSYRQQLIQKRLKKVASPMKLTKSRTLIIAPHPDDETFGCAGLIAEKMQIGVEVYVLFLTSGEKSLKNVLDKEVKEMRQKSAIEAVSVLGVDESHLLWLDLPDCQIPRKGYDSFDVGKNRVKDLIESLIIEEVYTTHYLEGWSDHLAAYELTIEAVKVLNKKIDVYLYWVWAWYYMSVKEMFSLPWKKIRLLQIKSVYAQKKKALDVYFDAKTDKGELYMGKLPKVFLKAFNWPYEVYEKVDLDDV